MSLSGLCLGGDLRGQTLVMQTYQIVRKERKYPSGKVVSVYWAEGLSDKCPKQTLHRPVSKDFAMEFGS